MITLAFDSTAKVASLAITDGEKLLALYNVDNGLTQSELLMPMAENMMKSLRLNFSDIKLLAASVGPGSFTGVRIGAALVKGIAFGKDIPCVSVSTLEAIAENITPLDGILVPVMDARRGQVYTAIFDSDGTTARRITEDEAMPIELLAKKLECFSKRKIYLAGDGYEVAAQGLLKCGIQVQKTPPLLISENAYSVALVAQRKYERGEYTSDLNINPTYLRLPQAERERLEKENNK